MWQDGVDRARLERPGHPLLPADRRAAPQGMGPHAAHRRAAQAAGPLPLASMTGRDQHGGGRAVFGGYDAKSFFDEVFEPDGSPRAHYADIVQRIGSLSPVEFGRRRALADLTFRNQGITFTVYGDESGTERTFPFDLFPRVIPADEWATIEAGLIQRVRALNLFLRDIYHEAKVLHDRVIHRRLVLGNSAFRREVHGIALPHHVYTHVSGIDLIRDEEGRYLV